MHWMMIWEWILEDRKEHYIRDINNWIAQRNGKPENHDNKIWEVTEVCEGVDGTIIVHNLSWTCMIFHHSKEKVWDITELFNLKLMWIIYY